MRVDDVLEVDAAVEQLVDLEVGVGVGGAHVVAVVGLGEEARGAQDQARQPVVAVDELAEVLGRDLRRAVDVLGTGTTSSVIQAAGAPGRRRQRAAERARRAGEDERPTPAATASSSRFSVPVTFVSTNSWRRVRADVRLVQRRGVQDRVDARRTQRRTTSRSAIEPTTVVYGDARTSSADDVAARRRAARASAPRRGARRCR